MPHDVKAQQITPDKMPEIIFIVMLIVPRPRRRFTNKESVESIAYLNGGSGIPWYK